VYLFGNDGEYYRRAREHKEIAGRAFGVDQAGLTPQGDFHIPRPWAAGSPFSPVDLDPWSDRLLCVDVRDEFGSKWYLYDLHTKSRISLNFSTFGVFLDTKLIDRLRAAKNG
jgi:hypothetical protein